MARLYVPNSYRLQQKILYLSWDNDASKPGGKPTPLVDELISVTGKSKAYVLRAVKTLQDKGFVYHNPQTNAVSCSIKGEVVLFKEEILDEGWEKFKISLLQWVQIIGIITASSIGLATFILTYTATNSNTMEIGKLQKEIEYLKRRSVPVQYIIKRPIVRQPGLDSLKKK